MTKSRGPAPTFDAAVSQPQDCDQWESPPAGRVLTHRDLVDAFEQIGKLIRPLQDRIKALEVTQLKLCGTYKKNVSYPENGLVTHRGGLWVSLVPDNTVTPGEGPGWRLAVKSGDVKAAK